jgi:hypothetical protein
MKPRLALTIGAVAAAIFGLLLTFLPAQMLKGFGIEGHTDGLIVSRDVGVTLLGLAVLNWLGRDAEGKGLRAILVANLAIQIFELVVNGIEIGIGELPPAAAPGLVIHLALGAVFALALRKREPAPA